MVTRQKASNAAASAVKKAMAKATHQGKVKAATWAALARPADEVVIPRWAPFKHLTK